MPTRQSPPLHERIHAAWQAAIDRRVASPGILDDFIGGIEVEATDGKEILADATVLSWLDGSVTPSYRYIRAIARVAGYSRLPTRNLLYGEKASRYDLTEKDWLRFVADSARRTSNGKRKPKRRR
jgi:hypothetical protein